MGPGLPFSVPRAPESGPGGFSGCQTVQLGADVGHPAGNDHPADAGAGLARLHDAHYTQWLGVHMEWGASPFRCCTGSYDFRSICSRQKSCTGRTVNACWQGGRTEPAQKSLEGRRQCGIGRKCDVHGMLVSKQVYMSMVLRISPTASPSISNGSPGSTTMVW